MIEANKIYLSYDNQNYIIKNTSFHIKPKDIVVITGVSGSGKSTLLKSLYGEMSILGGSLIINNQELFGIEKSALKELRQNIGVVFQDYKLINTYTAEENVSLPLQIQGYKNSYCKQQAKKLLSHVNLRLKTNKYPLELSGGEQQRIAVARAISHNPKIILADEPTGNLDEYSSAIIWDLFYRASKDMGASVVVVTHTLPKELDHVHYRRFHLDLEDRVLHEIF